MRAGVGWEGGATHSGMRRVPDTRAPFNPQIHESAPAAGCSCIYSCISSYICSVSICICVFICVCFVWFALFIQLCSLKSAPVSRLFRLRFAFLSHFLRLATSRRFVAAQLRDATVQWQLRDERRLCGIETNPSAALAAAAAALPLLALPAVFAFSHGRSPALIALLRLLHLLLCHLLPLLLPCLFIFTGVASSGFNAIDLCVRLSHAQRGMRRRRRRRRLK